MNRSARGHFLWLRGGRIPYICHHGFRALGRAAGVSGDGAGVCARGMAAACARAGTSASEFPVAALRAAAALGFAGIYVGEEFGGSGLTRLDAAIIFEELAAACVSTAAYLIDPQHGGVDDRPLRQSGAARAVSAEADDDGAFRELLPDRAGQRLGRGGARHPRACATATITCSTAPRRSSRAARSATSMWRWCAPAGRGRRASRASSSKRVRRASPSARRRKSSAGTRSRPRW